MDKTKNKFSEALKLTENWEEKASQLKERFPQLTDTDLKLSSGDEDALLTRLEKKLKMRRDEVINIIKKTQVEKV